MNGKSQNLAQILYEAIRQLPADQSDAMRKRHLQGWSLGQLAEHFGRTEVAVAGLLKRGMETLRKQVRETDAE